MSQIKIFEPSHIAAMLERRCGGQPADECFNVDEAESKRDRYLGQMALDGRCGLRDVLVANSGTIKRLESLLTSCPNAADAIGVVLRAAQLSRATKGELRLPAPVLLVGPPGVGKTRAARLIASALKTEFAEIQISNQDDVLSGHSISWRGARVGAIARLLIEGPTASPLVVLDELDKAQMVGHADLLDPLHSLLGENARAFTDAYLEISIRADKILWIATANDVSNLKPSLLDRFLVLNVEPPTMNERLAIIRTAYAETVASHAQQFEADLAADVVQALNNATPRRLKMLIDLAIGFAVAKGRRRLIDCDVQAAQRLLETPSRPGIGFFARGI